MFVMNSAFSWHSLSLLAFVLLHLISKANLVFYSRYLLTSYFCIPILYNEKDTFVCVCVCVCVLVLEVLVGLHRPVQLQLFGISVWGIDLDYCVVECFALEMN